jgi:agmatine/peptidylarginine deiminase
VVFDPFPEEPTGHADVHARFLRPGLMAVAWHPSDPVLQRCARTIENGVRAAAPRIRCLRVPLARQGAKYASLLNWIQIGRDLLLPRYQMTPEEDLAEARNLLEGEGFRVRTIFAPTIEVGGSLHCLTASVFI